MLTRIIALDPGGTTGWATYTCDEMLNTEDKIERSDVVWTCGQIGPGEHHLALDEFLGNQQVAKYYVVCESFEFRKDKQRDNIVLSSLEYIGVAKRFCQERELNIYMQTASMAKGFVSDEKIKALSLWSPGHKHAMDAYRHLIYFMVNRMYRYDLLEYWR